ncbi:MAG: V-type ATP synthase subunit E family protein [Thermofilum sp.]
MSAPSLLDAVIQEIRAAAQEEAEAVIRRAEEEAKRIVDEAQERARKLREERRQRLLEEARRSVEAEFAPKRLELKRRIYTEQYNLIAEELKRLVAETLEELRRDPARYRAYLERALDTAARKLGGSLVVHPCKGERAIIEEVARSFAEPSTSSSSISIGEEINCDGGFLARTPDERVYFNATLSAKVSEVFERLMPEVFERVRSARR